MNHHLLLLLLLGASATSFKLQQKSTANSSDEKLDCPGQFGDVAGRCLYFDNVNKASWYETRKMCQAIGGELIKLESGDLYAAIIRHMHGNGWPDAYYWIGASDEGHEGVWTWTDGSAVQMGTPFWANFGCDNDQFPNGNTNQNCAFLDPVFHLYFNDYSCDETIAHGICEI